MVTPQFLALLFMVRVHAG